MSDVKYLTKRLQELADSRMQALANVSAHEGAIGEIKKMLDDAAAADKADKPKEKK